jgi:hypothetical protein
MTKGLQAFLLHDLFECQCQFSPVVWCKTRFFIVELLQGQTDDDVIAAGTSGRTIFRIISLFKS